MVFRWLRYGLIAVTVTYAVLWAVTAIWGPAAMVARQRAYEDDYYGSMRVNPEEHRTRLHNFSVPAPFVVMASWDAGGAAAGRTSYSRGDQWGYWLPGRFWVVRNRMTLVACG